MVSSMFPISEKAVKKGQKIQDAHEAIRPTDISRTPQMIKELPSKRSVQALSADLETLCSQPDGSSQV